VFEAWQEGLTSVFGSSSCFPSRRVALKVLRPVPHWRVEREVRDAGKPWGLGGSRERRSLDSTARSIDRSFWSVGRSSPRAHTRWPLTIITCAHCGNQARILRWLQGGPNIIGLWGRTKTFRCVAFNLDRGRVSVCVWELESRPSYHMIMRPPAAPPPHLSVFNPLSPPQTHSFLSLHSRACGCASRRQASADPGVPGAGREVVGPRGGGCVS
jgi:hypothetical protein